MVRSPARILVVDDNPNNLKILKTRLGAEGYEIVTAVDGEQALAAVAAEPPDLILLDIMMQKVDGLEVCRQIRAANPDARVIVMSGMIDDVIVEEAIAAGAADCLPKAKAASQLIPAVKRAWRQ